MNSQFLLPPKMDKIYFIKENSSDVKQIQCVRTDDSAL